MVFSIVSASLSGHLTMSPLMDSCSLLQSIAGSLLLFSVPASSRFFSCSKEALTRSLPTAAAAELCNYKDHSFGLLGWMLQSSLLHNNSAVRACSSISPPSVRFFFFIKIKQVLFYHSPFHKNTRCCQHCVQRWCCCWQRYFPGLLQCELLSLFFVLLVAYITLLYLQVLWIGRRWMKGTLPREKRNIYKGV